MSRERLLRAGRATRRAARTVELFEQRVVLRTVAIWWKLNHFFAEAAALGNAHSNGLGEKEQYGEFGAVESVTEPVFFGSLYILNTRRNNYQPPPKGNRIIVYFLSGFQISCLVSSPMWRVKLMGHNETAFEVISNTIMPLAAVWSGLPIPTSQCDAFFDSLAIIKNGVKQVSLDVQGLESSSLPPQIGSFCNGV